MNNGPINSDFLSKISLILEEEQNSSIFYNKNAKGYDHIDVEYWNKALRGVLLAQNPSDDDKDILRKAWMDMLDKMIQYEGEY